MPTAKNGFHIFNLHPKKYIFKTKQYPFLNVNSLENFPFILLNEFYVPDCTNFTSTYSFPCCQCAFESTQQRTYNN